MLNMKQYLILLIILIGCSPKDLPEPINTKQSIENFFVHLNGDTLTDYYSIKSISDVDWFLNKYNIDLSVLEVRTTCYNGMCSMKNQMEGADFWTFFNIPESSWADARTKSKDIIKTITTRFGINYSGPGVIFLAGGGACPILDGTALVLSGDNRKKYYIHGNNFPHFCEAGNPIPIVTYYNGSIMQTVDPCAGYSDALKYSILKSALFGATLLITSDDMYPLLPGAYWERYGINGYGDPNEDEDAKQEIWHASGHGAE